MAFKPKNSSRWIRSMCNNVSGSSSQPPHEFDKHLLKEIESVKADQQLKRKRKQLASSKSQKTKPKTNELRDENGFKLRVVEVNNKRSRQIDPEYEVVVDGPLRRITPYYFTYQTFCKLRWRDRNLFEVFCSEFRDRDQDYYKKTIAGGSVYLNDKPANLESIIRNGDCIKHKIHRHEPPVTSRPIKVVYEDENILVIDKPSGIPVHPTGRYRFNTITKILEKKLGRTVHPCNRLDRLTSGLMFMAKTPKGADDMADQLKAREVSKEYIARVAGEFPVGEVIIENPLRSLEPKLGLNVVCGMSDEGAKHAKTVFHRISFDGETSIVKCKPLTGRTHQIRVHLQYLGHPIANDPIYSNLEVWGSNLGKNGEADYSEVIKKLNEIGRTESAQSWFHRHSKGELLGNEKCPHCETSLFTDPGPNDLDLWLHAYFYESTELDPTTSDRKWSYCTEFPDWALDPHRKYMELALEQAAKCEPTTTAFSVGAVLVNGTKVISTGYSRELPGNTHAEQCALAKYFSSTGLNELPEDTIIYTTMEPCSFRLSGNDPCVQRIIKMNKKIKTVFVGVLEPDTFVKNNSSRSILQKHGIDYIKIPGYEEKATELATKGHN
ncbi:DRAP deaminase [Zygosaccharomyces mellis]|uniref:tRNA pseudouridine(32) synthase n=1 Tax=Zygosaccharomyces mellis TaxID=42258 RepID=A0A4C2E3B9_9SACH|nr:DRAP deaminase [Zygosaccharomyces mellis]